MSAKLDEALDIAYRGRGVYPLVSGITVSDATTDSERIRALWADHPDAEVGVVEKAKPEQRQAAALAIPEIQSLDLASLAKHGIPEPDWILKDWLEKRDVGLVVGPAYIGKSTLIADLAVALSAGRSWLGMEADRKYRVGFVDEEQGESEVARLLIRLGAPNPNLFVATDQGIRIDTDEGVERLWRWADRNKLEIVFIDSTQQAAAAIDRNDSAEVGAIFGRLFALRARGLTTVLIHHPRKEQLGQTANKLERALGSQAWNTQPSTIWICERGETDSMHIFREKRRGGSKDSIIAVYSEIGDAIVLESGGTVGELTTEVSGCSEWILEHLREQRQAVKREGIVVAAKRLPKPYTEKVVDKALAHLKAVKSITRPTRGWYQLAEVAR